MTKHTGDILIVDDERSMREFLGIYLRREGYRIEAAAGGNEAIASIKARAFDVDHHRPAHAGCGWADHPGRGQAHPSRYRGHRGDRVFHHGNRHRRHEGGRP
jgi:hypothetical protein